jgi:hypothetical protein
MLHLWHRPKKGTMPSTTPLLEETLSATRVMAVDGLAELVPEEGDRVADALR